MLGCSYCYIKIGSKLRTNIIGSFVKRENEADLLASLFKWQNEAQIIGCLF